MRTFKVFQLKFTEEEAIEINRAGWAESEKKVAKVAAHLASSVNGKYDPKHFKHYEHVADIQALDLEDAFRISNCDPASEQIVRFRPKHSLSVGDILEDRETGERFFCARFGWNHIEREEA